MKTFYAEFGGEFFAEELGTDEKVITQFTIDEGQFYDEEFGIYDLTMLMSITSVRIYKDIVEAMPFLKNCVFMQSFTSLKLFDPSIGVELPIHLYDASGHEYF